MSIAAVSRAAAILRRGGLVAYPTETFYGLGAWIARAEALERLWQLKERPDRAPFLALVENVEALPALVSPEALGQPALRRLAERFWPGPLTLVLDARPGLHRTVIGPDGGVAVRVSSHPLATRLVHAVGGPVTSTSANRRGQPPARSTAELHRSGLAADLDFVLEGGQTTGTLPSTVVRLHRRRAVVIRSGAVDVASLAEVLADLAVPLVGPPAPDGD
jgi:L-threonylcarbamoyladenylate synthase